MTAPAPRPAAIEVFEVKRLAGDGNLADLEHDDEREAIYSEEPIAAPPRISALPPDAPVVEHALVYAARGWEIMPRYLARDGRLKDTRFDDMAEGERLPRTGLLGVDEVREYWARHPRTAAIAAVLGPTSDLCVLDVDQHEGGADGVAALAKLEAEHGRLPAAPFTLTPTGRGRHLYFAWPRCGLRSCKIAPGVEILADRAGANLPPSRKREGAYKWSLSRHVDWLPPPRLPGWLIRLASPPPPRPPRQRPPSSYDTGDRRARYVEAALRRELEAVEGAPPGDRNHQLNRSAWSLARFVVEGELASEDLEGELLEAAIRAGLERNEARATIRSGLRRRGS
jgi:hypothetical protein